MAHKIGELVAAEESNERGYVLGTIIAANSSWCRIHWYTDDLDWSNEMKLAHYQVDTYKQVLKEVLDKQVKRR